MSKLSVNPIAQNMTELITPKAIILFSYKTPVAAVVNGRTIRTSKFYSTTTSRHINKWGAKDADVVPQQEIEELLS